MPATYSTVAQDEVYLECTCSEHGEYFSPTCTCEACVHMKEKGAPEKCPKCGAPATKKDDYS